MSKSLRDQLLELGLARERPKRTASPKRARGRDKNARRPREKVEQAAAELSLEEAFRLREQAEQRQALQAKLDKQAEDRRRRELNQAIREVVDAHRLNVADAEEPRYFMYRGRIRKVYVTPEQLAALNDGSLGIVYLSGGYHLLEPHYVEIVRGISIEHVVDLDLTGEEPRL